MPLKQLRNKNKRQAATLLKCNSLSFKVLKTVINEKETRIYFNKTESFDMKSAVATHYYERYLDFKKREKEINP